MPIIKEAENYYKLCIATPYRVIYKQKGPGGKITTRVFPNLEKAEEFAASDEIKELMLIQPAKDPIPKKEDLRHPWIKNIQYRDLCPKCQKIHKLRSDEFCTQCSGQVQQYEEYVQRFDIPSPGYRKPGKLGIE